MRKRERENPCGVCGHYHRYEEGEVCGICGHRMPASDDKPIQHVSAFPSEILKDFLYLGSYDNASRGELLKTLGISRILNTVPTCQNLYKNSFTYHCLPDDKKLLFDDANQFLEQCEKDKARVLVHCMLGKNRSPAIVIAYLMRSRGWRFQQSFQWVKDLRQQVELTPAVHEQLVEFENRLFGSNNKTATSSDIPAYDSPFGFNLGFSNTTGTAQTPTFSHSTSTSISQPFDTYTAESMALLDVAERSLHSLPRAGSETPMDIQLHASCWERNPHGTAQTPTSSQSISPSISQHIGTYAAASSAFVFGAGRTYSTMPRAGSETPKDSL